MNVTTEGSASIDAELRARLGAIADEMIPAERGMPSATAAGAHEQGLDAVLRARPDLAEPLAAALAPVAGLEPAAAVERLRTDPLAWGCVQTVVASAYFLNPEVTGALGYRGQEALPVADDPVDPDDELIESARARGPVYRPTPGA